MSDPYVPQVGHLVRYRAKGVYIVTQALRTTVLILEPSGNCFFTEKNNVTFLADRSKEWEALFQLDAPTRNMGEYTNTSMTEYPFG